MNKLIENFLLQFDSDSTIHSYRNALNQFFDLMKVEPDKYFNSERNYKTDIREFLLSLEGYAPKTIHVKVSALKTFFEDNDIEFPRHEVKKFKRRKIKNYKPIVQDTVPSRHQLREIITHANVKSKALFLVLISSGLRIGEALQITLDDINLEEEPAKIKVKTYYTKTKSNRITFISNEAVIALKEWLKVREDYLNRHIYTASNPKSKKFNNGIKDINDNRVFPYTRAVAQRALKKALKESGHLKEDLNYKRYAGRYTVPRYTIHLHSFRKYFRTHMALSMKVDMVEFLMGHEGYLTSSYRDYDDRLLAKAYMQSQKDVTIFGGSSEADIEILQDRIEYLETMLGIDNYVIDEIPKDKKMKKKEIEESLKKLKKEHSDLP